MNEQDNFRQNMLAFMNGQCKEEQARTVLGWMKRKGVLLPLKMAMNQIWEEDQDIYFQESDQVDLSGVLDRVHHRINIHTGIIPDRKRKLNPSFQWLIRIAAIILIPLLSLTVLYYTGVLGPGRAEPLTTWTVPAGSRAKTNLPDGSRVWMNSGSSLTFPARFSKKDRTVYLEGEAYFEVAHQVRKPFAVIAGNVEMKVLGTCFNVCAYPDEDYLEVTLENGSLSITTPWNQHQRGPDCTLRPGEQARIDLIDYRVTKLLTETEKYTSWREGKLIFRNDPLKVIMKRLEKWYHAEIDVSRLSDRLLNYTFTLTIYSETLDQVLDYLSIAAPISYSTVPVASQGKDGISVSKYVLIGKK